MSFLTALAKVSVVGLPMSEQRNPVAVQRPLMNRSAANDLRPGADLPDQILVHLRAEGKRRQGSNSGTLLNFQFKNKLSKHMILWLQLPPAHIERVRKTRARHELSHESPPRLN